MSVVSVQTLVFISYCSPVQGRMAGASTSVYEFDNVVRDQHVYRKVHGLHSMTRRISASILREDVNCDERDKYAVNNPLHQHPKGGYTHLERYRE